MDDGMQSFKLYRGSRKSLGFKGFLCEVFVGGLALVMIGMVMMPCCCFGATESEQAEMALRLAEIEAAIEAESHED